MVFRRLYGAIDCTDGSRSFRKWARFLTVELAHLLTDEYLTPILDEAYFITQTIKEWENAKAGIAVRTTDHQSHDR